MRKIKHKYLIGGFLLFFLSTMSCFIVDPDDSVNNNNYSAIEPFSFEIEVENQNRIELAVVNGSVNIVGIRNASSVIISGDKIVKSDSERDAQRHLNKLEVEVSESSSAVRVETVQPEKSEGRSYQVNYEISIPLEWDIEINSVNGSVTIDSSEGDIRISLVNGDILLNDIFSNVSVGITNGKIDSRLRLPEGGSCHLGAINGQIQLSVPSATSAELSAGVTNGTISTSNLHIKNMQSSTKSLKGILGSGNGNISLIAVNGNINLFGY
jgi:hypothetical protein